MDIESVRDEFPITKHCNFQDHAAVAPLSRRAADAMRAYIQQAEDFAYLKRQYYRRAEEVRGLCARLINADADEVTFVKNTSEGLTYVANGLDWKTGDNVITTSVEFPANIYPWMNLEARGVALRMIAEEAGRIPLDKVIGAIDARTRVVAISAVEFASGCRTDLVRLGAACREKGVFLCVDAIQALGALPIDVQAMRIDFLSADGHKWLCGPEGAGVFYCRKALIPRLRPSTVGWMCMKNADAYGDYEFAFRDDARRFDSGSYNIGGLYGLGASVELLLEIGIDRVASQVRMLTDRLVAGVRGKGYRVVSPRDGEQWSGIVAFVSEVHDQAGVQKHLENEHRVVISVREGRLRASPHVYNTPEEVDQLIELLPAH